MLMMARGPEAGVGSAAAKRCAREGGEGKDGGRKWAGAQLSSCRTSRSQRLKVAQAEPPNCRPAMSSHPSKVGLDVSALMRTGHHLMHNPMLVKQMTWFCSRTEHTTRGRCYDLVMSRPS